MIEYSKCPACKRVLRFDYERHRNSNIQNFEKKWVLKVVEISGNDSSSKFHSCTTRELYDT